MSTDMFATPSGKVMENIPQKKDRINLLSDITLHQLSLALSQNNNNKSTDNNGHSSFNKKRNRKNDARCVGLMAYYSFSLNSPGGRVSVSKLCPELSRKGKSKEASTAICFLLTLCSRNILNGFETLYEGVSL